MITSLIICHKDNSKQNKRALNFTGSSSKLIYQKKNILEILFLEQNGVTKYKISITYNHDGESLVPTSFGALRLLHQGENFGAVRS